MLRPGTTTATIDTTASGKTTPVNLLPCMIDPTGGRLTVNDQDFKDPPLLELRSCITVVPQRAYLFFGTIASTASDVENPDAAQYARMGLTLEGV